MWSTAALLIGLALSAPQSEDLRSRPDSDNPIRVEVGIYLSDVILVDEPSHAFMADIAIQLAWMDARLAKEGVAQRWINLGDAWSPNVTLLNDRLVRTKLDKRMSVTADGSVRYLQRYTGTFNASFDLRDFPLDRQRLHFDLVFLGVTPEQIELALDEKLTGQRETMSITDWIVSPGRASIQTFQPMPGITLPSYVYEVPIERRSGYFIWKILLPLILIILMAGTVFWIDPRNSGPQISVSVSSILTLIAYRFMLGSLIPRLSYLTRLDDFIMGATLMVFGALVLVVLTSHLAASDRHERALRIDRWGRVLYPLVLVALLGVAFWA